LVTTKLACIKAFLPVVTTPVVSNGKESTYSVLQGGLCLKIIAASARWRFTSGLIGSVAKTIGEDGRTGINWIRSPLCGGIEKSGNEDRLSSDIASADLSNLPLPDHRHRFETCQCSSGGSEPAEAEPRSDQTLDAPMILLDNIIQILALPQARTAPEFAVSLHLRDRPWIGGVLVDRERARIDGVRLRERLAEEPLRRRLCQSNL